VLPLSALVQLSLGLEELFIILTVSCLASSAISTGRDCTAFSIPAKMSSIGIVRGVTAHEDGTVFRNVGI
jgi:hypothetical protein